MQLSVISILYHCIWHHIIYLLFSFLCFLLVSSLTCSVFSSVIVSFLYSLIFVVVPSTSQMLSYLCHYFNSNSSNHIHYFILISNQYFYALQQINIDSSSSLENALSSLHNGLIATCPSMLPAFKTLFNEIHIEREKSVQQRAALLSLRGTGVSSGTGTGTGQSIRTAQARDQAATVSRLMSRQKIWNTVYQQ